MAPSALALSPKAGAVEENPYRRILGGCWLTGILIMTSD